MRYREGILLLGEHNERRVKHYSTDGDLRIMTRRLDAAECTFQYRFRANVLRKMHDHALAGHGGVNTTMEGISRSFGWPGVDPSAKECSRLSGMSAAKAAEHSQTWLAPE